MVNIGFLSKALEVGEQPLATLLLLQSFPFRGILNMRRSNLVFLLLSLLPLSILINSCSDASAAHPPQNQLSTIRKIRPSPDGSAIFQVDIVSVGGERLIVCASAATNEDGKVDLGRSTYLASKQATEPVFLSAGKWLSIVYPKNPVGSAWTNVDSSGGIDINIIENSGK